MNASPSRDAELLALCARLTDMQAEWQRLYDATSDSGPLTTDADHAWKAYSDMVWPAVRLSSGAFIRSHILTISRAGSFAAGRARLNQRLKQRPLCVRQHPGHPSQRRQNANGAEWIQALTGPSLAIRLGRRRTLEGDVGGGRIVRLERISIRTKIQDRADPVRRDLLIYRNITKKRGSL